MKKIVALCLAVMLSLALVVPALADEPMTPTPPAWVPAEEYAVFEGSAAYEPENWEAILALRKEVSWGAINLGALPADLRRTHSELARKGRGTGDQVKDLGLLVELALVDTRLLYTENNGEVGPFWAALSTYLTSPHSELLDGLTAQQRYVTLLWRTRDTLRTNGAGEQVYRWLPALNEYPQFSLDVLVTSPIFSPEEQTRLKAEVEAGWNAFLPIYLDGERLTMDVEPEVRNQRTMVPIRTVAEALGANVEWRAATQEIVLTRAGSTVKMTLDSTAATVDGQTIQMDVAPYATQGRTLIPARYVAEFFGQTVAWDGEARRVDITEDKSVTGNSNLEAWALPMGAMLVKVNIKDPTTFGFGGRAPTRDTQMMPVVTYTPWKYSRDALSRSWNVTGREDLIDTVQSMTLLGHNQTFREMAADVKTRSEAERTAISEASDAWPAYMWEFTETVDEKWGDKGILAWDLFRMSNLVQWGYNAGYITYEEALSLLEPAAKRLCETFSSWDEAYENYLDGYAWWGREDVLNKDIWETQRGVIYTRMKQDPAIAPIFDDTLFETGVIGLPD